jgi:hypothetical protein
VTQKTGTNKVKNERINDLFKSKNDVSGITILKHCGDSKALIYRLATIKKRNQIMSQK